MEEDLPLGDEQPHSSAQQASPSRQHDPACKALFTYAILRPAKLLPPRSPAAELGVPARSSRSLRSRPGSPAAACGT